MFNSAYTGEEIEAAIAFSKFTTTTQTLTSVVSIPATAGLSNATISTASTLSLSGAADLKPGYTMVIRIANSASAARTITLPSTTYYVNDFGTTLSIPASSRAEVNILCTAAGYYSIRVGEV